MSYARFSDKPKFVPENYREIYAAPCIPEEPDLDVEMECYGTGIPPINHPMKNRIYFRPCENCKSENVLVVYAHWCVSTSSGDSYWDYEAFCEDCNKYTQVSFSEN